MQKLIRKLIVCLASLTLIFSGSVAAFHDLSEEDESYAEILQLHEMGIIGGIDGNFLGDKSLTFAEGIQMIVKGMDFSLPAYPNDDVPQAKDLFENVSEDAWYTDSLVIAAVNGLELSSDLDPDKVMTREAFTHHLFTALQRTGPYPFIEKFNILADQDSVTEAYMNSIQMMLNGEMVKLDEDRKFRPQEEMTRKEAVVMLAKAIEFRNIHNPILPIDSDEVTYTVAAVNDEIHKVTISWGEKPNPGYGIAITGIEFDQANQIATVMYQRHYPHPDRMYPQVIVTPTATTYVASEYTVEIDEYIQPILPDQPIKRIIPGPSLLDNTEAGEPDQAIH